MPLMSKIVADANVARIHCQLHAEEVTQMPSSRFYIMVRNIAVKVVTASVSHRNCTIFKNHEKIHNTMPQAAT